MQNLSEEELHKLAVRLLEYRPYVGGGSGGGIPTGLSAALYVAAQYKQAIVAAEHLLRYVMIDYLTKEYPANLAAAQPSAVVKALHPQDDVDAYDAGGDATHVAEPSTAPPHVAMVLGAGGCGMPDHGSSIYYGNNGLWPSGSYGYTNHT